MLAILFPDSSIMYLDAISNYNKTRRTSVSSHPIDDAAFISDHASKENPNFRIKGVVSAADFHNPITRVPNIAQEGSIDPAYNSPVNEIQIEDSRSPFFDFVPTTFQQFLDTSNTVTINADGFRQYSHEVARQRLIQARENLEIVTLLDYDYDIQYGFSISTRRIENCIITSFVDNESPDTGDALEFDLTFEKLRFTYIQEVNVDIVAPSDAASPEVSRGDQSDSSGGTTGDGEAQGTPRVIERLTEVVFGDSINPEEFNALTKGDL